MKIVEHSPHTLLLMARLQIEMLLRLGLIGDELALGYRLSGDEYEEARAMLTDIMSRGEEIDADTWLDVFYTLYNGDAVKVHHVLGQAVSLATQH